MDYSFYGGRPGFSFVIVMHYPSVDEMIECFKQGIDYEAVHFDEYVLINTWNKNDPDNGRIFRRGYDYTNDMGGAIYVGTIVGPAGRAPMLEMTTVDEVVAKQADEGYGYRYSEGEYAPLYNLVPGKTDDGEFRDSIKWACCSVRNENNSDTTAWIGFIFPYLVVDYEADSVSPYYNRDSDGENFTNINLVDRMDDESHPYWEKWHISVPKGIKGDAFKNFRVIVASSSDGVEPYDGQDDDRANAREILVYDYYHYDKEEGGEPVTIYLGDYNMISGITIDEDGTVTIEYTHDDTLIYPNLFKWIKEISIDVETGLFTIIYNYDTELDGTPTIYQTYLNWVNNITMTHEGVITIHYTTPENDHDLDEVLRWIDEITFDQDGTLTVYYNTGEVVSWDNQVKWVTEVGLTDDGDFHISFNNGDDDYTTHLTWVNDITFDNDGTIEVHYNDGTDDFTYQNLIKWVTNVSINTGDEEGTGNQKVHLVYNTGEEEDIGEPLNYIMKMTRVEDDYHLLVWYSDPAKRQEIIDQGKNYTYEGEDGWLDLGSVKDESGILIGTTISEEVVENLFADIDVAIEYLNELYPDGLQGIDLHGKVVTIGNDTENKKFYAYDYDNNTWYYVGSLDIDIEAAFIIMREDDPDLEKATIDLAHHGLWFILEGDEN